MAGGAAPVSKQSLTDLNSSVSDIRIELSILECHKSNLNVV